MTRAVLTLVVVFAALALPASGQQWLSDGGFEAGGSWTLVNGEAASCVAYEGQRALGVRATTPLDARASIAVEGPLPAGTFTLSGWTRIQSGSGDISAALVFYDSLGFPAGESFPRGILSGPEYSFFSVTWTANFAPESASINFEVETLRTVEVCIDSLELTTVDATATPTPSATASPLPGDTATATATATATPSPAPAISPTSTSTPTATATTTATPTKTPSPSPTATSSPSFVFSNGGFEQGLAGWSKYGGTLGTSSITFAGTGAGLLTSSTDSTKWAYQAVAIDPAKHYEFSGHVRPDGGVKEAYLRISWYSTSDATISALSTSDSLSRAGGETGSFVYLTTGAVQPPAGAKSARVRILLAPSGAGSASLVIDDVSFAVTTAPTPTPSPTASGTPLPQATAPPLAAAPAATIEATTTAAAPATEVSSQALAAPASAQTPAQTAPTSVDRASTAEVAAVRSAARAGSAAEPLPASPAVSLRDTSSRSPWPWLIGIGLLVAGLAGAYLQNKRAAS